MFKTLAIAALIAGSGAAANAALVYPTSVYSATQPGTVAPSRSNTAAALGAADGKFYSLGLGGELVLDFGRKVGGTGVVTEVTFSTPGYKEFAKLSTSLDGVTWTDIGTVFNADAVKGAEVTALSAFRYLKFVDASPTGKNRDGFDVDSVGFAPVPLPAAGFALLAGLAGLATLRRRR